MNPEDTFAQAPPDPDVTTASLTIGDLAERTGVSPAVLRRWETRHGFPEPKRLDSGHRRYSDDDVSRVQQVLRRKEAGVRLDIAIADSLAGGTAPARLSIFAETRRRHPAVAVHRLTKLTLIGLSWAIEDECCAVADRPILFGAFQLGDFYAPSAARWTEMARVARSAIVFADGWEGTAENAEGPIRATLAPTAPMRREWAVVCDAFAYTACLTAWELPGQETVPDRQRIFEAAWSIDPAVVRDAARVAAAVAADAGVLAAQPLLYQLAEPPPPRSTSPAGATALFNRVLAYVDRLG